MKVIICIAGIIDVPSDETMERDLPFIPTIGDSMWIEDEDYELEENFKVLDRIIGFEKIILYVVSDDHPTLRMNKEDLQYTLAKVEADNNLNPWR